MGKEISADYYEILQVNPKADQEMIERAYRLLAKRYHPDNQDTGDSGKFGTLMEAYLVLSNPDKRAAYDCNHERVKAHEDNFFLNIHPSRNSEEEARLYQAILLILYVARRADVTKPGVGTFSLEKLLGLSEKELEFHLWYLKEKGWIQRAETGGFAITVNGVDAVIEKNLLLRKDRLLPQDIESSLSPSLFDPSDEVSN